MNTLLYWQNILTTQECALKESEIIQTLELIQQGEYRRVNLKKLKGSKIPLYRAKINEKERLIFAIIEHHDEKSLLLIDVLTDHKYENCPYLNDAYLKKYLDELDHKDLLVFMNDDFQENPKTECLESEDLKDLDLLEETSIAPQWRAAFSYHEQQILLDPSQQELLDCTLPAFVEGVAGSGKTCTGFAKILNEVNKPGHRRRILYITMSSRLINEMSDEWDKARAGKKKSNVAFVNYKDFLEVIAEQIQESKLKLVTIDHFKKWLDRRMMREDAAALRELSIDLMVSEARFLSGLDKSLFDQECFITDPELKNIFNLIFLEYQKSLISDQSVNIQLTQLRAKKPIADLIIVDEAQAFSGAQLQNIKNATEDCQVMYCYDQYQNLVDDVDHLKWLMNDIARERRSTKTVLTQGHRCQEKVAGLANKVLDLRAMVSGKSKAATSQARLTARTNNGHCDWISKSVFEQKQLISQFNVNNCNWAVVIPNEDRAIEARSIFGETLNIFTQEQIRGLEYEYIILFSPFEDTAFKQIQKVLSKKSTEHEKYVNISDQERLNCRIALSKLFTASTRSKNSLLIVADKSNYRVLNEYFELSTSPDEAHVDSKLTEASSEKDWHQKAIKLIKEGLDEQARAILIKHCPSFNPEEEILLVRGGVSRLEESDLKISSTHEKEDIASCFAAATEKKNVDSRESVFNTVSNDPSDKEDVGSHGAAAITKKFSPKTTLSLEDILKPIQKSSSSKIANPKTLEYFFDIFLEEASLKACLNCRLRFKDIPPYIWQMTGQNILESKIKIKNESFSRYLREFATTSWLNALLMYAYHQEDNFVNCFESVFFASNKDNAPLINYYVKIALEDIKNSTLIFKSTNFKDKLLRFYVRSISLDKGDLGIKKLIQSQGFYNFIKAEEYDDERVCLSDSIHSFFNLILNSELANVCKNSIQLAESILNDDHESFKKFYDSLMTKSPQDSNSFESTVKKTNTFLLIIMAKTNRVSMSNYILESRYFDIDFMIEHCNSLDYLKSKIDFSSFVSQKITDIDNFLEERTQKFLNSPILFKQLDFYFSLFPVHKSRIFQNGNSIEQFLLQRATNLSQVIYNIITGRYHPTFNKSFRYLFETNNHGRSFFDDFIQKFRDNPTSFINGFYVQSQCKATSSYYQLIDLKESACTSENAANCAIGIFTIIFENHCKINNQEPDDFLCYIDSRGRNICDLIIQNQENGLVLDEELIEIGKSSDPNSLEKLVLLNQNIRLDNLFKLDYAAHLSAAGMKIGSKFFPTRSTLIFLYILGQDVPENAIASLNEFVLNNPALIFQVLSRFDKCNPNFAQILKRLESINLDNFSQHAHLINDKIFGIVLRRLVGNQQLTESQTNILLSNICQSGPCSNKIFELYDQNKITLNSARFLYDNFRRYLVGPIAEDLATQTDPNLVFMVILILIVDAEKNESVRSILYQKYKEYLPPPNNEVAPALRFTTSADGTRSANAKAARKK